MRILVTGGCGFIGSAVAESFLASHNTIVVVDNFFRPGSDKNASRLTNQATRAKCALEILRVDISDNASLLNALEEKFPFDLVLHFAGQVAMTSSMDHPLRDFAINALGTLNMLEMVRHRAPDALFLFASTNKVYGDLRTINLVEKELRFESVDFPMGFDESRPLDFSTPYGCSKGCADSYVRDYARVFGLRTCVLRLSSIYGPLQFADFNQGWISWFLSRVVAQYRDIVNNIPPTPFTISGSGKQVRDILYVGDLANLIHRLILHPQIFCGEAFNVGGGVANSLSILELLTAAGNLVGGPGFKIFPHKIEERASDQRFYVSDTRKVMGVTGWEPKTPVLDGLRLCLDKTFQK